MPENDSGERDRMDEWLHDVLAGGSGGIPDPADYKNTGGYIIPVNPDVLNNYTDDRHAEAVRGFFHAAVRWAEYEVAQNIRHGHTGVGYDLANEITDIMTASSQKRGDQRRHMMIVALQQSMLEMGYTGDGTWVFDPQDAKTKLREVNAPDWAINSVPDVASDYQGPRVERYDGNAEADADAELKQGQFPPDMPPALRQMMEMMGIQPDHVVVLGDIDLGGDDDEPVGLHHECTGEEAYKWMSALVDLAEHKQQYHGWVGSVAQICAELLCSGAMHERSRLGRSLIAALADMLVRRGHDKLVSDADDPKRAIEEILEMEDGTNVENEL